MGHSALQHETIATIGITTFQQLLVKTQCEIGAIQRSCYVILIVLLWPRSYLCSELSVKPASSKCSYPAAGASIHWHVETGCFLDKSGEGHLSVFKLIIGLFTWWKKILLLTKELVVSICLSTVQTARNMVTWFSGKSLKLLPCTDVTC